LDQVFTLISDADGAAGAEYEKAKAWNRRIDMIAAAAEARIDVSKQDVLKAVLRLAKRPARKRDELAHEVWAVAAGFEEHLVLLSSDIQRALADALVAAKRAGTNRIPVENKSIYEGSSLVSGHHLDALREELRHSQQRLTDRFPGYLYEPILDESRDGFWDSRSRLETDPEIQARVANMRRERHKTQKRLNRSTD